MMSAEEAVVEAVLSEFDALPKKSKPRELDKKGVKEWVPLCGIVTYDDRETVKCEALGTGMKCLPFSKIPTSNGNILHDSHAEIIAIRAFNRFLLGEAFKLLSHPSDESHILRWRTEAERSKPGHGQPFAIKPELRLSMYCSEAPCGDASMELIMARQSDATPWPVELQGKAATKLMGRECFSQLGVVRRKPARGDSPMTLSKSCSDKLALKQCTSLLTGMTAAIIVPNNAYIDTLILPQSQYVPEACERAFGASGRMHSLHSRDLGNGYVFRPFKIATTNTNFRFSQAEAQKTSKTIKASNISTHWTSYEQQTTINGVLQGRKQDDPAGACVLSRRRMSHLVLECARESNPDLWPSWRSQSYEAVKRRVAEMTGRDRVKADVVSIALKPWTKNAADDFTPDFLPDFLSQRTLPCS